MSDTGGAPELIAFVKVKAGSYFSDIQKDINIQILVNLGSSAVPARIINADVIPRTENGKPNRAACKALVKQARKM
jgi:acyl-coenzyme A synthetase/AMP-(fatty) acid ligase